MKRTRAFAIVGGILVLMVGLVVIPGWINGDGEEAEPTSAAVAVSITEEAIQATEMDEMVDQEIESQETDPAQAEALRPTPRAALDATDPSTVSLGSGEIQLVEFFAYW